MLFNKAPIQTRVLEYATSYMEECLPVLEKVPEIQELTEKQETLYSLGFKNCTEIRKREAEIREVKKIAKKNQELQEQTSLIIEMVCTFVKGRYTFGPNTLLLRFEDFYQLMKKNRLVCGSFEDYLGDIPEDKLKEIETLVKRFPLDNTQKNPIEPKTLCTIDKIETDHLKVPDILWRFPFLISNDRYIHHYSVERDIRGVLEGSWAQNGKYRIEEDRSNQFKFFICAPEKKMRTIERRISLRQATDPLICSFINSPMNCVFIHTRWGEEANLEVIRKYEKLNFLIDQRAKELGITI